MLYGPDRAHVSGLPDGRPTWIAHNAAWNRLFGVTFTGFAISGAAPRMDPTAEAMYASFSPAGLVDQGWPGMTAHLAGGSDNNNLPVFVQSDVPNSVPNATAALLAKFNASDAAPQFWMFRSVLTGPTFLASVSAAARNASVGRIIPVDPITLGVLAKVALGGHNNNRVSYVGDTIPHQARAGDVARFNISVRNDGWNVLGRDAHALLLSITSIMRLVRVVRSAPVYTNCVNHSHTPRGEKALAASNSGEEHVLPTPASTVQLLLPLRRPGSALQRYLDREGWVGEPLPPPWGLLHGVHRVDAGGVVFPLPADIGVSGGLVVVPASINMPSVKLGGSARTTSVVEAPGDTDAEREGAVEEGEAAPLLLTVTYQLCVLNATTPGACGATFDGMGNLPWVTDVLVVE